MAARSFLYSAVVAAFCVASLVAAAPHEPGLLRDQPDLFPSQGHSDNVTLVGRAFYGQCVGVDVEDTLAYVCAGGALLILDISDPPKPSKVGHYAAPGWFSDVVVSGDHAYLTIIKSGLHIIDINEPSNPKLVGSCKLPGNAGGVALARARRRIQPPR